MRVRGVLAILLLCGTVTAFAKDKCRVVTFSEVIYINQDSSAKSVPVTKTVYGEWVPCSYAFSVSLIDSLFKTPFGVVWVEKYQHWWLPSRRLYVTRTKTHHLR